MPTNIEDEKVQTLLSDLIGREVELEPITVVEPHSVTARGLVTDDDDLVAVIASDLEFAHRSGAALAMMPANTVAFVDDVDDDLMAIYQEVANVVSRLVNEAMQPVRVRLDPDLDHSLESLQEIVVNGHIMSAVSANIEGYGNGRLGVWQVRNN